MGRLQDGPKPTGLREVVQEAGRLEQYLYVQNSAVIIALYEKRRRGKHLKQGSKEKPKSLTLTRIIFYCRFGTVRLSETSRVFTRSNILIFEAIQHAKRGIQHYSGAVSKCEQMSAVVNKCQ